MVKKNESNHTIDNSKAFSVEPPYQIAVTDSLGSPRPESADLLKSREASRPLGRNMISMIFGSLKSGGSDTDEMDVSRYRDLSQLGKYTIRVSQFDAVTPPSNPTPSPSPSLHDARIGGTGIGEPYPQMIVHVLKEKKIPWSGWQGFRRGLAATLYGLGVADKTIQQIVRHADVAITMKLFWTRRRVAHPWWQGNFGVAYPLNQTQR